jgi:hypothetical protein
MSDSFYDYKIRFEDIYKVTSSVLFMLYSVVRLGFCILGGIRIIMFLS